jgi:hypothetical protein
MRKRITLLVAALMLALTMAFGGAGAAFADPPFRTENPGGQEQGCGGTLTVRPSTAVATLLEGSTTSKQ